MTISRLALVALLCACAPASAAPLSGTVCTADSDSDRTPVMTPLGSSRVWQVDFGTSALDVPSLPLSASIAAGDDAAQTPRPKAFEYSHGYEVRRKIHVVASVAMIPLFVTQGILGAKLYNHTGSDTVYTAHKTVAAGIGALFALNTVTGVWNLWEGRNDPNHRVTRRVHGILMLSADAGFLATALLAPRRSDLANYQDRFPTHRAVAITSIALATTGYLVMLFSR
jgi:hypothetical protein